MWRRLHTKSGSRGYQRMNFYLDCCRRRSGQLEWGSREKIRVSNKNYFNLLIFEVLIFTY